MGVFPWKMRGKLNCHYNKRDKEKKKNVFPKKLATRTGTFSYVIYICFVRSFLAIFYLKNRHPRDRFSMRQIETKQPQPKTIQFSLFLFLGRGWSGENTIKRLKD